MNKTPHLVAAAALAGSIVGVATSAVAQPTLVKKWESDAAFKVPESVPTFFKNSVIAYELR